MMAVLICKLPSMMTLTSSSSISTLKKCTGLLIHTNYNCQTIIHALFFMWRPETSLQRRAALPTQTQINMEL